MLLLIVFTQCTTLEQNWGKIGMNKKRISFGRLIMQLTARAASLTDWCWLGNLDMGFWWCYLNIGGCTKKQQNQKQGREETQPCLKEQRRHLKKQLHFE